MRVAVQFLGWRWKTRNPADKGMEISAQGCQHLAILGQAGVSKFRESHKVTVIMWGFTSGSTPFFYFGPAPHPPPPGPSFSRKHGSTILQELPGLYA